MSKLETSLVELVIDKPELFEQTECILYFDAFNRFMHFFFNNKLMKTGHFYMENVKSNSHIVYLDLKKKRQMLVVSL